MPSSPKELPSIPRSRVVYAGVGSRKTPNRVLSVMRRFARSAAQAGWILRSGGAKGADQAFEAGCDEAGGRKRIFYATREDAAGGEGDNPNGHHLVAGGPPFLSTVKKYHPAPRRLSGYARRLMARNAAQVLGAQMERPANLVVCWTPDGATSTTSRETGGTGQAIRLANAASTPVINLHAEKSLRLIVALSSALGESSRTGAESVDPRREDAFSPAL